jgi:polar amino acid transport system substrate-binding protein
MHHYIKFCFIFLLLISNSYAKNIKICTDENFWYPFTYSKDQKALGLHIDITKKAIIDSGYSVEYIPMPWKRCLNSAKKGTVDAIVSASYKEERASYLTYPDDAINNLKSIFRITQVEYIILTSKDSDYIYDGDLNSIPRPVRGILGYSIVDDLKKAGIEVDTAKKDTANLKRLQRDKKGSVITLKEIIEYYQSKGMYQDDFIVHKKPIKSKSYYMPFSKQTTLSKDEIYRIWNNIKKIRENKNIMNKFLEKY